ncbi:hypothetical protein BD289DRAFT_434541 [Coniella lustricola]|uniref:Uncharacterized protein n=1 Tax=Coniella lustricola TaxID=2025994 RepID=A0A2T3A768_9PEZI|nr:hypothetical protein BD289DRAFT_434541 [Coniella lustricola]
MLPAVALCLQLQLASRPGRGISQMVPEQDQDAQISSTNYHRPLATRCIRFSRPITTQRPACAS